MPINDIEGRDLSKPEERSYLIVVELVKMICDINFQIPDKTELIELDWLDEIKQQVAYLEKWYLKNFLEKNPNFWLDLLKGYLNDYYDSYRDIIANGLAALAAENRVEFSTQRSEQLPKELEPHRGQLVSDLIDMSPDLKRIYTMVHEQATRM